jgi:hypothetical protein
LPDPRNHGHGSGPQRIASYGHQFGPLHDRIVGDQNPDDSFYSKISNKEKVDYICHALRVAPNAFHLDLPLPLEDWAHSDDLSLINCGLYFADMRRQFYERLLNEHKELRMSTAFGNHAEAEFWNFEFNRILARRRQGMLLADTRSLN